MPRSNRRQGKQGRQSQPGERTGGFEQTGSGYRFDDQRRRFGQQGQSYSGRNWPGQEDWREPSERSRYSEGRDYGSGYEQESRFSRGGYEGPRNWGQGWSSQGYPESYRGFEGRGSERRDEAEYWNDEPRYGRGREQWGSEDYENESEYEGYEPGDYSYSERGTSGFGSSGRGGGYRGSMGEGRSSFGQGGRTSFGQGRWTGQGSRFGTGSRFAGAGMSQGAFAGRGPQGYKRSDERITEDVNETLTQDSDIDATNITVEVQNGEVTLKGSVSDREAKRRAEDLAESCSGVREVQNQLRIKREDQSESESKRDKSEDKRSHRQQIAS